jgi:hypothetical protein
MQKYTRSETWTATDHVIGTITDIENGFPCIDSDTHTAFCVGIGAITALEIG